MGQKLKLSLGLARKIAARIAAGDRIHDAADACGVPYSSVANYCKQSPEFNAIITEALSKGKRPKQRG